LLAPPNYGVARQDAIRGVCFPTVAAMSIWFWLVRLAIVHNHTMGSLFLSLLGALRSAFRTHADP